MGGYQIVDVWTGPIVVTEEDKGKIVEAPEIYNYKPVSYTHLIVL